MGVRSHILLDELEARADSELRMQNEYAKVRSLVLSGVPVDDDVASRLPYTAQELVAVAFSVGANGGELLWYQLTNTLEIPAAGDQFHVDGMELHALLSEVEEAYPDARLEVLWHSHYSSSSPSSLDVDFFAEDMFGHGEIYHTPTRRTISYNKQGIIQPL